MNRRQKHRAKQTLAAKRKKDDNEAIDILSSSDNDSDHKSTTLPKEKKCTWYVHVQTELTQAEIEKFGNGKYKEFLYEDTFINMSMIQKAIVIHFFIQDFHKELFPTREKRGWKKIYAAAAEAFDKNWTWEIHKKYTLNCDNFEPTMERNEYHLFFTPHQTNIKQAYLVCKESLIPDAGYGIFNQLPLRKGQIIGCLFGFEKCKKTHGYDMANKEITGYDFQSHYGTLNAVCGMNTKLYRGKKPHPLFGMHMLNDIEMEKRVAGAKRSTLRESYAYFNDDLSVVMKKGVRQYL